MNRPLFLVSVLGMSIVATAALAQGTPGPGSLSDSEIADLVNDDPYVRVTQDGNNNRAELIAVVNGTPEAVWEILMDYEEFEEWFPDQREARIVSENGNARIIEGETRVPLFRNRHYQLSEESRTEVQDGVTVYIDEWEYVPDSGNIESNNGFWYAEPYGENQTLLRMVLEVDLGMWLPDALLNWGTRRVLPGIIEGLHDQL